MEKPKCKMDGCFKEAVCRGYCINHYQALRRRDYKEHLMGTPLKTEGPKWHSRPEMIVRYDGKLYRLIEVEERHSYEPVAEQKGEGDGN